MVDGAPTGLPGRQCGTAMVMAWSDDPELIKEAEQLVRDAGGPVPMAMGQDWFVADISRVAQTGGAALTVPESTDLEGLARALGGEFRAG
jgi:hypothetical protein